MISTLIISLIVVVFLGGGTNSFALLTRVKKRLKTHIKDKERAKEAVALIKAAMKKTKEYGKQYRKDRKALAKLQSDRQADMGSLQNHFGKALTDLQQIQQEVTTTRLEVRNFITEAEWDSFVTDAMTELEKKAEKIRKRESKAEIKVQKILDRIRNRITKVITASQAQKEVLDAHTKFEGSMIGLIQSLNTLRFDTNESVRAYNTSSEALLSIYDATNANQERTFDSFMHLREELLRHTDDRQWRKITRSLRRIFKR